MCSPVFCGFCKYLLTVNIEHWRAVIPTSILTVGPLLVGWP